MSRSTIAAVVAACAIGFGLQAFTIYLVADDVRDEVCDIFETDLKGGVEIGQ